MHDGALMAVQDLLKRSLGLDAASIGSASIARAVELRAAACGLCGPSAYWQHLQGQPAELQELIEAVVVPETWFLRDREAFVALARLAGERLAVLPAGKALRLLSLPCSTGEEPFSMAMALLDAGLPAARFQIDAIDISHHALALARRAVYGANAFRGTDAAFRARNFSGVGEQFQLNEVVRQQVRFRQGNLLDDHFLPGEPPFDFVFCRNVLIYFDRATQQRAVAVLRRLLQPQGTLFVGPAEAALLLQHDFQSLRLPLAFAFRHAPAPVHTVQRSLPARRSLGAVPPALAPAPAPSPRRVQPLAAPVVAAQPQRNPDLLAQAKQAADQGRLAQARQLCAEYLHTHPGSAPAQYLMGLVRDAGGEHAQAAASYRRALYLDPDHEEALLHLAYLLQEQGDHEAAQRLRQRAERSRQRKAAGA